MEMGTLAHRVLRPYSRFAVTYDRTLGIPAFFRTRRAFEALVRRYGIRFRSAADLGCGTGLFACYLSQCWSIPVFAVDISPAMLREAARNCSDVNVCLLHQDIRSLRLPHPVDLVTANFDTLNHLVADADLRLAFRRMADNLRPGGHLYFDLITPCQPLGGRRSYVQQLSAASDQVLQQIHWSPRQRILSIVVIVHSPRSRRSTQEVVRERAYSPREVGRWLLDVGFVIRGIHDAATLHVASGCPPRIIVVAQKHFRTDGQPLHPSRGRSQRRPQFS
jgi:SAM-dependent methyltransferase